MRSSRMGILIVMILVEQAVNEKRGLYDAVVAGLFFLFFSITEPPPRPPLNPHHQSQTVQSTDSFLLLFRSYCPVLGPIVLFKSYYPNIEVLLRNEKNSIRALSN